MSSPMLKKLAIQELQSLQSRQSQSSRSIAVPRKFVAFCNWLGVELTHGQRVIASIAYDGLEPRDLDGEDRAFARDVFGDVDAVSPAARAVAVFVCGGRGGKSYVLVALRLVWGMYTRDLSTLAPGQRAVALIIAMNEALRQEVTNYALGAIRSHAELRTTLRLPRGTREDETPSAFRIERPDGQSVTFEGGVASRGGYGGRGRSLTDVALDEAAFFRDASYQVNDEEIFKAAAPRVLPGGQAIIASTPWAEAGLLYNLYSTNWGKPVDAIVAHAPTLSMRPAASEQVERERRRDPDNAEREFDARFMRGGTTLFFPTTLIEQCIDESLELPILPQPGQRVSAGGDFGFRADSSSLAITHRQGRMLTLAALVELRPTNEAALKPSETVRMFASTLVEHGCSYLMADGHYREAIVEYLAESGLAFADAPTTPADAYVRARTLMREGRVRIPRHGRLLQQLKEVQGRPTPGGGLSIVHPRWRGGGHGDLVASWVLALWQQGDEEIAAPPPERGTSEWEDAERAKRRAALKAEQSLPWWKRRR